MIRIHGWRSRPGIIPAILLVLMMSFACARGRDGAQTRPAATQPAFQAVSWEFTMLLPVQIEHTITISPTGALHSVEKLQDEKEKVREGQMTAHQMEELTRVLRQCRQRPSRPQVVYDAAVWLHWDGQDWNGYDARWARANAQIMRLAESFPIKRGSDTRPDADRQ